MDSNPKHGRVVGSLSQNHDPVCTVCYAGRIETMTVLSDRESEVAAHKQLTDASHEVIAERIGVSKSTVDEYSRRFQEKVRRAKNTVDELRDFHPEEDA